MKKIVFSLIGFLFLNNCDLINFSQNDTGPSKSPKDPNAVNYCQALVVPRQALELSQVVVDAFNQTMDHLPGFVPAEVNKKGIRPNVNFETTPPRLYYADIEGAKFHATLCTFLGIWYKCSDENLKISVNISKNLEKDLKKYEKYYEPIVAKAYSFRSPRYFGPVFFVIPLEPHRLYDPMTGQEISDDLHISVVKIEKSDGEEDAQILDLRERFKNALEAGFAEYNKKNHAINLDEVLCSP